MEKQSRQRALQLRRLAKGLCSICGVGKMVLGERCQECLDRFRAAQRISKGCKAWHEGGKGRPPMGARKK